MFHKFLLLGIYQKKLTQASSWSLFRSVLIIHYIWYRHRANYKKVCLTAIIWLTNTLRTGKVQRTWSVKTLPTSWSQFKLFLSALMVQRVRKMWNGLELKPAGPSVMSTFMWVWHPSWLRGCHLRKANLTKSWKQLWKKRNSISHLMGLVLLPVKIVYGPFRKGPQHSFA